MAVTPESAALLEQAEKLKAFIREHQSGGCKMLSIGDRCPCPLCAVDALTSALEAQAEQIAALTREKEHLQIDNEQHWLNNQNAFQRLQEAEARADRLAAALRTYGSHKPGCECQFWPDGMVPVGPGYYREKRPCTCGLTEVVTPAIPSTTETP